MLFKTVCDNYELLPAENYKLPPEAEGLEPVAEVKHSHTILKPDSFPSATTEGKMDEEDPSFMGVGRTNTRRHIRSSPSTGSAVTTVLEADEDDSVDVTQKLVDMHIAEDEADPNDTTVTIEEITQEPVAEIEAEAETIPEPAVEVAGAAEIQAEATPDLPSSNASGDSPADHEEPALETKEMALTKDEDESTVPVALEEVSSTSTTNPERPKTGKKKTKAEKAKAKAETGEVKE